MYFGIWIRKGLWTVLLGWELNWWYRCRWKPLKVGFQQAFDSQRKRRGKQKTEERGEREEWSKYGSFEFWPGRQIGSTSETEHIKKRKSGRFLHFPRRRPAQMKLLSMCSPHQPRSPSPSRNPPSLPRSVCLSLQLFTSVPILSTSNSASQAPLSAAVPLSHLFSAPYVNLFLSISLPLSQSCFLSPEFFLSIPSVGTVCGRMRCFNESVLSSSFEGGQWLMQEGGESTQTGEPCAHTNTRAWINTLTRLAVCARVCNTSVEMPASLHLTETVTLPGPDGKNSW